MENLYDTLGVSRDDSDETIKKAYRKLARKLHPDINPGDASAEDRFKKVSAAYDVVGDKEKRKLYDEFGEDATKVGFDPDQARAHRQWKQSAGWRPGGQRARSAQEEHDLFEELFGGGRGFRSARGPQRGQDYRADLVTDFRTSVVGGLRSLSFGEGRPIDVRIPPGVSDGGSIRLRGKGGPGSAGGPAGDLVITLHVEPHKVFRRDGLDLHMDLPITLVEAMRGGKVEAPLLEGSVKLSIPSRSQSGQILRLKGRGVNRRDKRAGDLFVHLVITAPDGVLPDEALEQLEAAYTTDVRGALRQEVAND